jgi:hypothetical protein
MSFPTSKAYNASFGSNARVTVWTDAHSRACAQTKQKQNNAYAPDARLWGIVPARLRQRVREKIPDRFLPNL